MLIGHLFKQRKPREQQTKWQYGILYSQMVSLLWDITPCHEAIHSWRSDHSAFTARIKMKATQIFRTPGTTHPTTQHHTEDNRNVQQDQCFTCQ
jgi:hypothetical protein